MVRSRIGLACVAGGALLALATTAKAEPYAGQYLYAEASTMVVGVDGARYQLAVTTVVPGEQGTRSLTFTTVRWARCTSSGCTPIALRRFAYGGAVADDRSKASLKATKQLSIGINLVASRETVSGEFSGLRLTEDPVGVAPEVREWRSALGSLSVLGQQCHVSDGAEIGFVYTVDTRGPDDREAEFGETFPVGLTSKGKLPRCVRYKTSI